MINNNFLPNAEAAVQTGNLNIKAISDLKLFNEKVAVLDGSSFADAMLRSESAFMFSWKAGENAEAILVGAEGESVDAAFLTLRMFLQDNDRISIRNIARLYADEQALKLFKSEFSNKRNQINALLDRDCGVNFPGKHYSNGKILDLLIYGSKAHTNPAKELELRKLLASPFTSKLYLHLVNIAAANLINGLKELAKINQKALSSIEEAM
jgi:hypothetical protein